MVHARMARHSYANWALRLDADSLTITHISARPVIHSGSYSLGGYFKGVLIVGSFHEIWTPDGRQVSSMILTMLFAAGPPKLVLPCMTIMHVHSVADSQTWQRVGTGC